MKFQRQFMDEPFPITSSPASDEQVTDTSGYIPPMIQIENMINAGQRLNDYRRELYDFPDGEVDDEVQPGFTKATDPAEITQAALALQAKIASQNAQEASQQAVTGSDGEVPPPNEQTPE